MARNPFYPGYYPEKQNQTPINPLYPGYYPGRRVQRKPGPRGPKPTHFVGFGAGDSFSEFVDGLSDEAEGTLRGPDRWLRERMADDFDQSFKVYGESPNELPSQVLDNYETGSLPGGGYISLNLDPREWLGIGKKGKKWMNEDGSINRDKEAPRKMVEKTLKGWAKSALNFQDLETKARTDFWNDVVSSRYDSTKHSALENAAYQFITGAKPGENYPLENPLALDNVGVIRYKSGVVVKPLDDASGFAARTFGDDLYKSVGSRTKEFVRYAENAHTRDTRMDRLEKDTLDAFSEEAKYAISLNPSRTNADVDSFLKRSDFSKTLSGLGFKHRNMATNLSRIDNIGLNDLYLKGLGSIDPNSKDVGIRKALDDLAGDVKGLRAKLVDPEQKLREELIKKHGAGYVADLETYVTNMEGLIKSNSFKNVMDPSKNAAELTSDIRNIIQGLNSSAGLKGQLKGRSVTGGDIFMKSLERRMLDDLCGEAVANKGIRNFIEGSHLNEFLRDQNPRSFFTAGGRLDPDAPLRGGLKLLTYIPRTRFIRDVEAAEEVISQLPGGKYSESYIFTNRIAKVLSTRGSFLTGKGVVDRALEKVYKFGLVLGKDDDLQKRMGRVFNNLNEPGMFFGNRFSIDAKVEKNGRQTATEIKSWGGKHYNPKNIEEYKNWMITAFGEKDAKGNFIPNTNPYITGQHLNDLFLNKKRLLRPEIFAGYDFNKLMINGDAVNGWVVDVFTKEFAGLNLLDGCKNVQEVKDRIAQIIGKQKEIDEFVEYLHKIIIPQFKAAGIDVTDSKFLYDFIYQLDHMKELQSINQRYLGMLQKVGMTLTKFQEFAYKIPVVGYVAKQVAAVKTMFRVTLERMKVAISAGVKKLVRSLGARLYWIAKKIGLKNLARTIAQAFGSAAPIVGNIIAWVVAELVILATKLIAGAIKAIGNFTKRLMKGELTEYLEEAEKKMDKNAKRIIYILIILTLIMTFFSPLIGFLIPDGLSPGGILTTDPFSDGIPFTLSTFSPTDPTRLWGSIQQSFDWNINLGFEQIGGGGGGGGVGVGNGEITSSANCFKFVSGGTCGSACSPYTDYDAWSPTDVTNFTTTIKTDLARGTGSYKDRLCQAGDIYVHRSDVSSAGCRGYVISNNDIIIYGNCINQTIRGYLFAHETGHVYNRRFPDSINGLAAARATDHGSLPTYAGGTGSCGPNNNESEDFAETVGDWINILFFNCNVPDVGYTAFWNMYPGHKSFAQSVLFY